MKFLKLAFLFMLTFVIMTCSAAAAEKPASTITVQGASTLTVIPDQAVINIGVTNSAPTVTGAQDANAKAACLIEQKLLLAGIAKENIRTVEYSISPIYTNEDDKSIITGYQASNTVAVTINDIASIGTIIDGAAGAGANQISGIQFKKKEELKLKQTVLKNAVEEATAKAEAIADALNKQIVRVVTVNENGVSIQTPNRNTRYEVSLKAGTTPIQAGSMEIHGTVVVVFEIQ